MRTVTHKPEIVLVTVRGPDGPGITARLTEIIAKTSGVRLLDIEQTVVHQKLLLSLLLTFDSREAVQGPVLKEMLFAAKETGVDLAFEVFDSQLLRRSQSNHQYVVTCLGTEVTAYPLSRIAKALATRGVNIERIGKLTQTSLSCVELSVRAQRPLDHRQLTKDLLGLSTELAVDIAVQPANIARRAKRLIVLDMDKTLIQTEVIDELGREAGAERKIRAITEAAMAGKRSFAHALHERVKLLQGLSIRQLERVRKRIKLTPGAERLIAVLKHLGFKTALLSGGFTYFTEQLRDRLAFDYAFANELEIKNGRVTGRVTGEILDGKRKALLLRTIAQSEGISLDQVVAVGDGANDLGMLSIAGLGIAFHAHRHIRKKTGHGLSQQHGLDTILYLLGISEQDLMGLKL